MFMQFSSAQNVAIDKGDKESFSKLKDAKIKHEIAFFNSQSSLSESPNNIQKQNVNEIPLLSCTDSAAIFSAGDIKVSVYSTKFNPKNHKLSYLDPEQSFLTLIDNKPFWGKDGGVPKEKIKSVKFVHGKKFSSCYPTTRLRASMNQIFATKTKQLENRQRRIAKHFNQKMESVSIFICKIAIGLEPTKLRG
jgi:hypothetical protein